MKNKHPFLVKKGCLLKSIGTAEVACFRYLRLRILLDPFLSLRGDAQHNVEARGDFADA